jgi:hypothetical protein
MTEPPVINSSNSLLRTELQILRHAYPTPQGGMSLQKLPLEGTHHPCKINNILLYHMIIYITL